MAGNGIRWKAIKGYPLLSLTHYQFCQNAEHPFSMNAPAAHQQRSFQRPSPVLQSRRPSGRNDQRGSQRNDQGTSQRIDQRNDQRVDNRNDQRRFTPVKTLSSHNN